MAVLNDEHSLCHIGCLIHTMAEADALQVETIYIYIDRPS